MTFFRLLLGCELNLGLRDMPIGSSRPSEQISDSYPYHSLSLAIALWRSTAYIGEKLVEQACSGNVPEQVLGTFRNSSRNRP